jgi:hypothetical protein
VLEVLRRDEFQGRPDSLEVRERSFNKRLGEFVWYVVQLWHFFVTCYWRMWHGLNQWLVQETLARDAVFCVRNVLTLLLNFDKLLPNYAASD